MIVIGFVVITLVMFSLFGWFAICILDKLLKTNFSYVNNMWKLYPIIGAVVLMNVFQLLQLVMATHTGVILFWVLLAMILCMRGRWLIKEIPPFVKKNRYFIICILAVICIIGFPMILSGELCSVQIVNNDIIYYLSTMDWLKDHTLLEPVIYSEPYPYYICARQILNTTRFGADILGSLVMCIFSLEAHQVFATLGITYAVTASLIINYFAVDVLKISDRWGKILFVVVGSGYGWADLIARQYSPQILGIACLAAFVAAIFQWYINDEHQFRYIAALFLAGTATSYSEFCSYMVIIFIGLFGIHLILDRRVKNACISNLIQAFQMAALSLLANPLGILIAIKFNLHILHSVSESASSIDSYDGVMKSGTDIIATLFGMYNLGDWQISWKKTIYFIVLIGLAIVFMFVFLYKFYDFDAKKAGVLWLVFFFGAYELYFRIVHLGYGEFKHLSSISPFAICIFVYFFYRFYEYVDKPKWLAGIASLTCMGIISLNLISGRILLHTVPYIRYDSGMQELQRIVDILPKEERIGVCGRSHMSQHQLVYILKNRPVQLLGTSVNSYFSNLGIPLSLSAPSYVVRCRDDIDSAISLDNYYLMWENDKFQLLYGE